MKLSICVFKVANRILRITLSDKTFEKLMLGQSTIDEELFDVVSGFEALKDDSKN
jgi:hypothetical protein